MSTDYIDRLHKHIAQHEKNLNVPPGDTAKTDKTPTAGSFGSFGSSTRVHIRKKHVLEPLPVTCEWLEAQGCRSVLPLDVAHIKRHLPVGTAARNRVLLSYVDTWLQAAKAEPAPHRKNNAGRKEANIAIREGRLALEVGRDKP